MTRLRNITKGIVWCALLNVTCSGLIAMDAATDTVNSSLNQDQRRQAHTLLHGLKRRVTAGEPWDQNTHEEDMCRAIEALTTRSPWTSLAACAETQMMLCKGLIAIIASSSLEYQHESLVDALKQTAQAEFTDQGPIDLLADLFQYTMRLWQSTARARWHDRAISYLCACLDCGPLDPDWNCYTVENCFTVAATSLDCLDAFDRWGTARYAWVDEMLRLACTCSSFTRSPALGMRLFDVLTSYLDELFNIPDSAYEMHWLLDSCSVALEAN